MTVKKNPDPLPEYDVGPIYVCRIASLTLAAGLMKATEEKWLSDLYGSEYGEYCKRVNRCWPWLPVK